MSGRLQVRQSGAVPLHGPGLISQGFRAAFNARNMLTALAHGHDKTREEIMEYADELDCWIKDVNACRSEAVVPNDDDDDQGHGL